MTEENNRILTPGPDIRQSEDQSKGLGIFLSVDGRRLYSVFKPQDMMEFAVKIRDLEPDKRKTAFVLTLWNPKDNAILDLKITIPPSTPQQREKGKGLVN